MLLRALTALGASGRRRSLIDRRNARILRAPSASRCGPIILAPVAVLFQRLRVALDAAAHLYIVGRHQEVKAHLAVGAIRWAAIVTVRDVAATVNYYQTSLHRNQGSSVPADAAIRGSRWDLIAHEIRLLRIAQSANIDCSRLVFLVWVEQQLD